ncbi:MAG: flagellar biosynthesis anti-sigma factor FlgM [Treponema sp.]|nr:flagellar biosynthesis anti-sigma factor FlgM [Treponema sp.]
MMVDKIGGMNPLNNVQNTRRTNGAGLVSSRSDSISVSAEAKEMATLYYMKEVASTTPDVRADRIAAVKEAIKNPGYVNAAVLSATADRLMANFGI